MMDKKLKQIFEEVLNETKELDFIYLNSLFMQRVFDNFSINEAEEGSEFKEERYQIEQLILSVEFDTNPKSFFDGLEKALKVIIESEVKYNRYLIQRSLKSLRKENIKTYKIEGFDIGFALKKNEENFSEIIAMYNTTRHSGLGYLLIQAAVKLGGKTLKCFGKDLVNKIYRQSGFKIINETQDVQLPDGSGKETLYKMEISKREKSYK